MKDNHGNRSRLALGLRQFKLIPFLAAFILCVAVTITVYACGWDIGTEHSVRFNTYRTEKDFARLPRLPRWESAKTNRLFSWDEDVGWTDYEEKETKTKTIIELFDKATMEAEKGGDLPAIRNDLLKFLEQTSPEHISRHQNFQKQRNAAFDMLDALSALEQGSSADYVRAYLIARIGFDNAATTVGDFDPSAIESGPHFQVADMDKNLRDNTAYLKAAYGYFNNDYANAEQEFLNLFRQFPKSEKREAALFMAALCALKQSNVYEEQRSDYPEMPKPCLGCRDEYWEKAYAGFKRVMNEYPKGRYYHDAQG